jgi:hypothetical protein
MHGHMNVKYRNLRFQFSYMCHVTVLRPGEPEFRVETGCHINKTIYWWVGCECEYLQVDVRSSSHIQNVHTGYGVHPAPYSTGTPINKSHEYISEGCRIVTWTVIGTWRL